MKKSKYTVFGPRAPQHTDKLSVARELLKYFNDHSYIQYNESGIKEFQENQNASK